MINEHIIERELRQTLPRRVRNKGGLWGALKPFWWVLLPHTWIAVVAPLVFVWMLLAEYLPEVRTQATVTRHYTSASSKGKQSKHVVYKYTIKGHDYDNEESVPDDVYADVESGNQAVAIAASRNPLNGSYVAHIPNHAMEAFMISFGTVWCTIWCACIGAFAWGSCGSFLRSSRLVSKGVAVGGKITEATMTKGSKGAQIPTINFTYEARVRDGGLPRREACTGKMRTNKKQFEEIHIGDVVTVLYDERRPHCSIVYKYSDHEAFL